ncbi:YdcH family protein [Pseudomonas sp. UL073]|uniref:YdcH family protein n=1 Tax=Zestomonas insulae TaxID=2809017 RepID=A0ABS2IEG1_9GAMM|nr:YdcH family protein [Pseudomonas insulae]MBM7061486.1 YdcH family protein [Pseudomonas insulae]
MPLEHHPLTREFPQYQGQLRSLMQSDAHFSRLAQEYQAIDQQVYDVEDGRQPLDDLALQGLKLQRVALKDQIARLLQQAGG